MQIKTKFTENRQRPTTDNIVTCSIQSKRTLTYCLNQLFKLNEFWFIRMLNNLRTFNKELLGTILVVSYMELGIS